MFIDRTSLLNNNPVQLNYGAAVTDFDDDGEFEIIVAGFGAPNLVLKWNGRAFVDVADDILADPQRQAIGIAAGDINGDGREEIYILNTDTFAGAKQFGDRLFLFRGRIWVDLFALPDNRSALNLTAGRSVICVDRMGTGRYGFFVANYGGPLCFYELKSDGLLYDIATDIGVDLTTGGRSLVALPLVSEHIDVFAGNEHGPNFLFVNQGDGTFAERASDYALQDALDSGQAGQFALVYGNWEGSHRLFMPGPRGMFRDIAPTAMANPSRIRTVIVADFDNDGYEEIFFNNLGQPNRLFAWRDEQWTQVDIGDAAEPDGMGTGAVIGDFDGDGRLELLISHGESAMQRLSYYHVGERTGDWLRVLPLTADGAPARGAVVLLHQSDRVQSRVIDNGSGYLCQMEPVAHFGLGDHADDVQRVEIRWPDGVHHVIESPDTNHLHRVAHPESS